MTVQNQKATRNHPEGFGGAREDGAGFSCKLSVAMEVVSWKRL
jgi:hypothetical protein